MRVIKGLAKKSILVNTLCKAENGFVLDYRKSNDLMNWNVPHLRVERNEQTIDNPYELYQDMVALLMNLKEDLLKESIQTIFIYGNFETKELEVFMDIEKNEMELRHFDFTVTVQTEVDKPYLDGKTGNRIMIDEFPRYYF